MYKNKYRTRLSRDINETLVGETVRLAGFAENIRDHGGIKFLDLRDFYGTVQVTFSGDESLLNGVTRECSLSVEGEVILRAPDTVNPKLTSGTVEIKAAKLDILGKVTETLPFEIADSRKVGEDTRLKYRFLDLRNRKVKNIIVKRSELFAYARQIMSEGGFLELQTPLLSASSPEGARDYLIPSRKHKGKFYALPQAPQLFKQLYMTAGFDNYFQLAPCFRDEDARADRTPGEFYQLDFEMAFATQEDVLATAEDTLTKILQKFSDKPFAAPFPRIAYSDAILKYGSDKPDLRNPLILVDLSDLFVGSGFKPFADKTVRGLRVPNMASQSKSFFKSLEEYALSIGMGGLGYVKVEHNDTEEDGKSHYKYNGPIDKFLDNAQREELKTRLSLEIGDVLYFIADDEDKANKYGGAMRTEIAGRLKLIDDTRFAPLFVIDFPFFEADEDGAPIFSHNPFSMPQTTDYSEPLKVKAYQYDCVLDGVELLSGAVRNHDPERMLELFKIAGYGEETVKEKFGALYNAFKFGAPPHAGAAFGLDRLLMILLGEENIREVIAFPLNGNGQDLLLGAPSDVTELQLRETHIKIR
ncbi:MAG: aspartate--tRNA ligase [Oscillospiraceae bacterium]|jgi:aspartyl-tRNA synthetase|nr:aspartate--tRNA ligase [Oscillospiraceae bacterium]